MWTLLSTIALTSCLLAVVLGVPLPNRMTEPRGPGLPASRSPRSERPEIDMVIHDAYIKAKERASRPGSSPRQEPRMTEMDMKLTDLQQQALHRPVTVVGGIPVARIAISDEAFRWTDARIPYVFDKVFTASQRAMIRSAMDEWEKYTCVTFVERRGENNYVNIISDYGCWSEVGMVRGKQSMSIDIYGCLYRHTIIHELGHTIGFHHEQTRPDRDEHVQINLDNIQSGLEYNFDKYDWGFVKDYGIKYDHASVMHYASWAFTRNGKRTIVTKDSQYQELIGTVPGPSVRDIQTVLYMYRCAARCDKSRCPTDAIINSRCECWCNTGNPADPVVRWDGTGDCKSANAYTDPCVDFYSNCSARAGRGECDSNPTSMLIDCRRSCRICGPNPVCKDYDTRCEGWSLRGECESNPSWMNRNCRRSCGVCGTSATPGEDCEDQSTLCASYANSGDCEQYRDSMLERCPLSCKACINTQEFECRNWHVECDQWAKYGRCNTEQEYMKLHCPRACGLCSGGTVPNCKNYAAENDCARWADEGECATNPSWMLFNCAKSCRSCGSDKVCLDRRSECASWKNDYCDHSVDGPNMYFYCPASCGHCTPAPGTHKPSCQNFSPWCEKWEGERRCHSNPDLMLWSCPRACNICGPAPVCDNYHDNCATWAASGECEANPNWMLIACAKSCGSCNGSSTGDVTTTPPPTTTPTTTTTTTRLTTTRPTTTIMSTLASTTLPDEEDCSDYAGTKYCAELVGSGYTCEQGSSWMPFNCMKTCRNCGSNAICKNYNPNCAHWADTNQCVANPGYMLVFCRAACTPSCQTAPITTTPTPLTTTTPSTDTTTLSDSDKARCTDYDKKECERKARQGDCVTKRPHMFSNCPNTCKVCGPGSDCKDYNTGCTSWAAYQECTKNPGYMLLYCRKACQVC